MRAEQDKQYPYWPEDCECFDFGPKDADEQKIGVDETKGRYGDVYVWTCRSCGRKWLLYFAEYEAFTGSGRWIRGILPCTLPVPLTPENAWLLFRHMPWFILSGSAFYLRPPGRRAFGEPLDLISTGYTFVGKADDELEDSGVPNLP